jgi:hypothetical protein
VSGLLAAEALEQLEGAAAELPALHGLRVEGGLEALEEQRVGDDAGVALAVLLGTDARAAELVAGRALLLAARGDDRRERCRGRSATAHAQEALARARVRDQLVEGALGGRAAAVHRGGDGIAPGAAVASTV